MKQMLIILLMFPFLIFGQNTSEPGLYEVVYLKVKPGQEKAFEAAVKKHNLEYHKDGTIHHADLRYVINGPYGGHYSWIMGPTNFTAMDTRPGKGSHDEDWQNVVQYVESNTNPTYWSTDWELSFQGTNVSNGATTSKSLIWIYDLKEGRSQKFSALVTQVKKVYQAKRPNESLFVYWNEFSDTKAGKDVAVVFPFNKYAWLDRSPTFKGQFEAVHGAGTYDLFLSEFRECVNGRVDFLREKVE